MITENDLKENDFRHLDGSYTGSEHVGALWQKRVRNEKNRTLYFIEVIKTKFGTFYTQCRMYRNEHSFDLNFVINQYPALPVTPTVETVIMFYKDSFERLGCTEDPNNND